MEDEDSDPPAEKLLCGLCHEPFSQISNLARWVKRDRGFGETDRVLSYRKGVSTVRRNVVLGVLPFPQCTVRGNQASSKLCSEVPVKSP